MLALSQCPGILVPDATAGLQAALNLGQPIAWDCDVTCVMGSDPSKGLFAPSGSNVTFMPKGRLNVDNCGFPALAFLNVPATWQGLNIRYTGTPPLSAPHASNVWNDVYAKAFLAKQGVSPCYWEGPTNTSALVSVRGSAAVTITGGRMGVDPGVTADRFALAGFDLGPSYLPNSTTLVLPTFTNSDFEMDGVLMGYVGGGASVNLTNVTRKRYADLQDANGDTVGGVGTWMAPPHWMYFNDSPLAPIGVITIKDAVDLAEYCGPALRRVTSSGYINAIKIPLNNGSSIDGFYSRCADGGVGILAGQSKVGGKIRNMTVVYDSSIRSVDGKPCSTSGIFWPNAASAYPAQDIEMEIRDRAGNPTVVATPAVPGMNVNVTVCT